jgi:hypothetical protein
MTARTFALAAAFLAACSSPPGALPTGSPLSEDAGGAAPVAAGNACGLRTAYAGDEACLAASTDPNVVQLRYGPANYDDPAELGQFLIAPGDETLSYEIVSPLHAAMLIESYDVSERTGMHHLAFYNGATGKPNATAALINPAIFLTQVPTESVAFDQGAPELAGAALKVPAGSFVIAAHAINMTDRPQLVEAWVNLHTVASTVRPISPLQMAGGAGMTVPAHTKQTIRASVVAGHAIDILQITGHFHAHTTEERVAVDGAQKYSTSSWSEPSVSWFTSKTAPLHVPSQGVLSWECDVDNTTNAVLRWSNAVMTGEMCNVVGFVVGPETWTARVQ